MTLIRALILVSILGLQAHAGDIYLVQLDPLVAVDACYTCTGPETWSVRCQRDCPEPERIPLVTFTAMEQIALPVPGQPVQPPQASLYDDVDTMTTSDPAWTCALRNDCNLPSAAFHLFSVPYVKMRLIGYVFNPARPAPPGTVALLALLDFVWVSNEASAA